MFQTLVLGMIEACFSFWVQPWMTEFGVQRAAIMTASTLTLIVGGIIAPFAGRLVDRWSVRGMIVAGLAVFAGGLSLMTLQVSALPVILTYGISTGIALMLVGPLATQTLCVRWFSARRGFAMGVVVAGAPLGGITMPPIIAHLLGHFTWRTSALTLSAVAGFFAILAYFFIRNSPADAGVPMESGVSAGRPVPTSLDEKQWTVRELLHDRGFIGLALAFFGVYGIGMGLSANFRPLTDDLGISGQSAAFITSFLNINALVSIVLVGKLADRFDPRWILIVYVIMISVSLLIMATGNNGWPFTAAAGIFGVGVSCFYPLQGAIVGRFYGAASFGRILGLLNLFFLLGATIGPIGGAIRDYTGSYLYFLIGAAVVIPCLGLFIFLLKRHPNAEPFAAQVSGGESRDPRRPPYRDYYMQP